MWNRELVQAMGRAEDEALLNQARSRRRHILWAGAPQSFRDLAGTIRAVTEVCHGVDVVELCRRAARDSHQEEVLIKL